MRKIRQKYRWVAGIAGTFLLLLITVAVLLPAIIDSETMRVRIQTAASRALEGEFACRAIDLSLLPRPSVTLHATRFSIPEKIEGTVVSVTARPKILPLIIGRLRLAALTLASPDLTAVLPPARDDLSKEHGEFSRAVIDDHVTSIMGHVTGMVPGLVVAVKGGRLSLSDGDKTVHRFEKIEGRLALPPGILDIDLVCASDLWDTLHLTFSSWDEQSAGGGRLDIDGFRPRTLVSPVLSDTGIFLKDAVLDLHIDITAEGPEHLRGEVVIEQPAFTFMSKTEALAVRGREGKGTFEIDNDRMTASVTDLQLDSPKLAVSGAITIDSARAESQLELTGRNIEVEALRRAFLFAAGKNETVRDVWDIVRAGTVEDVTVKSAGATAAELAHMANITAKGSLHGAGLIIPGIDLTVDAVNADISFSDGVLEGTNIDARWNTVAGSGGSLQLGLAEESLPIHFEINAAAELAALSVLDRFSDNDRVTQEMKAICAAGGHAAGRLIIDGTIPDVAVTVALADLSLAGGYARLPFPVKIAGGQYFYTRKTLGVRNLKGTIGQTSFIDFSAEIDLDDHHALTVRSAIVDLSVDEIFPWLTSFVKVKEVVTGLTSVRGSVELSSLRVSGPLKKPAAWQYEASGGVRNIICEGPAVQGAVTLERARFTADENTLAFSNARIKRLDAVLDATGTLHGYTKDLKVVDITLQGSIGTKAMRSLVEMNAIPHELTIGTPFLLSSMHLVWKSGDEVMVVGEGMVAEGPRVALDLVKKPHELHIAKVTINDSESDFTGSLRNNATIFDFAFDGHLVHTTMKKLLPGFAHGSGGVKGKIKAAIVKKEPSRSKADGVLQIDRIQPIWGVPVAMSIETVKLHTVRNNLVLDSVLITLDGRRYSAAGTIGLSGDVFDLDLNVTSNGIEWSTIEKFMARQADNHSPERIDPVDIPTRGTVSLRSEFFRFGDYTWYPMNADVRFGDRIIDVDVKDAVLCGIATPGHFTVTPRTVTIDFETILREKNLEPFVTCISKGTSTITGTFELQGAFKTAEFKRDFKTAEVMKVLTENLNGTFELTASDVRVIRSATFSGLLTYLNGTDHFDETISDIEKEGLTFFGMNAKVELAGGTLVIHEATYEGKQLEIAGAGEVDLVNNNINFKMLVAPLKKVDAVVKKIPVVGYILDGSLITIPVVITGTMDDPRVSKMSPAEVGASLLGIMKRTLNLPVRVIEPVMKYPQKFRDQQSEN